MVVKNTSTTQPSNNDVKEAPKAQKAQKTKANMQPEQQFKRSFTPLLSKVDDNARLTFAGYKHSISKFNKPFLKIVFTCLDVTRKNPANIGVLSSYKYNETNVLGRLLTAMGYEAEELKETILDEDDEFGYVVTQELSTIYDFLDSKKGLVFKGLMTKGENDPFYRIEVSTLEIVTDKDGNQKRDYDAVEGISEKDITVDLEVGGGDDEKN